MLLPKKVKHRKWQKGRSHAKKASRITELSFGSYGLKSVGSYWITSKQIEAARRAMTRYIKKGGKIWIRIFPDKPITHKGVEVPMGGGKGGVDHYVVPVKPGTIIFEVEGVPEEIAKEAIRRAGHKLPIPIKFIKRT